VAALTHLWLDLLGFASSNVLVESQIDQTAFVIGHPAKLINQMIGVSALIGSTNQDLQCLLHITFIPIARSHFILAST
jgi:hypothetical protein